MCTMTGDGTIPLNDRVDICSVEVTQQQFLCRVLTWPQRRPPRGSERRRERRSSWWSDFQQSADSISRRASYKGGGCGKKEKHGLTRDETQLFPLNHGDEAENQRSQRTFVRVDLCIYYTVHSLCCHTRI